MKKFVKKAIVIFFDKLGYKISLKDSRNVEKFWSGLSSNQIRRLFHYEMFMKTISISGNIVECGVASGGTLAFFKNLQKEFNCSRKIWGFDSFEGFSSPNSKDGSFFSSSYENYNKKYSKFTLGWVKQNLIDLGAQNSDDDDISLIKGWIPDSLEYYDGSPVSLLNVDVDIYEPTKAILEFFWPLLQDNAVILLDEYDFGDDAKKWPGAKIAIDEFCNEKNTSVSKHYTGRFYITKT